MKRQLAVSDFLKPLDEAPMQAYLSNALQVADIMEWIIGQIGECDIIQSSFSVSEEYLRRLYFMKAREQVKSITLLLDLKATNMTVKLWVFISQLVKNTFLADNHSKILLFSAADGRRVSVITSQNLTRGNRNESTVVTTCPQIYKSLYSSIQDIIRNNSVPLTEIMDNAMNFTPPPHLLVDFQLVIIFLLWSLFLQHKMSFLSISRNMPQSTCLSRISRCS